MRRASTKRFERGSKAVSTRTPMCEHIVSRGFSRRVDYPKGNSNNPVTSEELVESFRDMAKYSATPLRRGKIDATIEALFGLEEVNDVAILAQLLVA
jgi:2-methylcitrate dehydratase PrpD